MQKQEEIKGKSPGEKRSKMFWVSVITSIIVPFCSLAFVIGYLWIQQTQVKHLEAAIAETVYQNLNEGIAGLYSALFLAEKQMKEQLQEADIRTLHEGLGYINAARKALTERHPVLEEALRSGKRLVYMPPKVWGRVEESAQNKEISVNRWIQQAVEKRLMGITDIPLRVSYRYDFEEVKNLEDTAPWRPPVFGNAPKLRVSDQKRFARSGRNSLHLQVDLKPFKEGKENEFTGVYATDLGFSGVRAISAKVLVPDIEKARGKEFLFEMFTVQYDLQGKRFELYARPQGLVPGIWSPVFLGTFYSIWSGSWSENEDCKLGIVKDRVDTLHFRVRCYQDYSGPLYIDDITIYAEPAGAS